MYKVCTLVGTRPELIKLSRIIPQMDKSFKHILVHSGQNYDYSLNKIFFNDLKIRKPDYFLNVKSDKLSKVISNIIYKTDIILEKIKPDALLVYGDTNTSLGIIAAKRKKIPIFHMEAGNRCFDQRVPEEINRKIVDHLSDINMPLTEHARQYLISEGIPANRIIKTGSCMNEILNFYKDKYRERNILSNLNLKKNNYFLVSAHREENVDYKDNLVKLIESLNLIAEKYNTPINIMRIEGKNSPLFYKVADIRAKYSFLKNIPLENMFQLRELTRPTTMKLFLSTAFHYTNEADTKQERRKKADVLYSFLYTMDKDNLTFTKPL